MLSVYLKKIYFDFKNELKNLKNSLKLFLKITKKLIILLFESILAERWYLKEDKIRKKC